MTVSDLNGAAAPASFAAKDWPQNAWYVAAWDVEVTQQLFARTICGENMVMYRTRSGDPVVLRDACWHRLLPLSMGHVRDDVVVCGYHGLEFDQQGRCVYMPSQDTINPAAVVQSYPAVERHRFVWVWPGDPALADPDLIPDMHWNDDPAWAGDGKTIHVKCNYKLVVDNLMDLTHETYVHAGTIGDEHVVLAPFEVTHGEETVTVTRWMRGIDPPPFLAHLLEARLQERPGPVDRWQIIRFEAPSTIVIDVGVALTGTGAPEGDRSQGVTGMVLNTMTPERDGSCHYFWAFMRDFRLEDQRLTTYTRESVHGIFGQDEVILEAQQRAIDANPDKEFYNLNLDAGAMWARRLIDRQLEAERAAVLPRPVGGREQSAPAVRPAG